MSLILTDFEGRRSRYEFLVLFVEIGGEIILLSFFDVRRLLSVPTFERGEEPLSDFGISRD